MNFIPLLHRNLAYHARHFIGEVGGFFLFSEKVKQTIVVSSNIIKSLVDTQKLFVKYHVFT